MTVHFAKATVTVSGEFIWHVRFIFEKALDDLLKKGQTSRPRSTSGALALPTYLVAVAAVEAAMNELFLSDSPQLTWGITPPENYDPSKLERLPPIKKLLKLPKLFFGRTLKPRESPIREMWALVNVRNGLGHYKFAMKPPPGVRLMAQQGAAARVPPEQEDGGPHPWADRVSTLEGILWAHDTACRTVRAVVAFAPQECRPRLLPFTGNFNEHHESKMRETAQKRGIDLG
jgi:hypothetical protein